MHQDTSVPGRSWKAILDLEPIVAMARIADKMPAWLAQTYEHPVADLERAAQPNVGVGRGDVDVPAR